MSALRYSVPGRETVWVDLGPAPGRRSHGAHDARPVENVGQMVPIMGLPQSTTPARQAQMKAYKLTRKFVDDRIVVNPDNGGVEASHHRGSR